MKILFLCPHGAAKSVLAVALAAEFASQRSIEASFANAGTEPDEKVSATAADAIERFGLSYSGQPQLVGAGDIASADVVVNMGCLPQSLPAVPARVLEWLGLPDASDDVDGLCRELRVRIEGLLDDLTGPEKD